MSLAIGTRLGPYEIVAPLGTGGMGEVYRATDTNLKRAVALKVLPDSFASDPDRLARFQREAEVLAALNHPNIAAIHGVERSSGTTALVMELVEGPTLAEPIARGSIPLDEALPIARQIADALEAAHERGVIHRDLKPANIKVTPDGQVKVLDFGLAKMLDSQAPASSLTMSPTVSVHATHAGVILGTAAYMSPEQARGRPVDKRTDIWAFGCVLFEMVTGKRPFDGEDVTEAIAAVVKSEPAWQALPPDVPAQIQLLLRRCLEKDPRARIADISTCRFLMTETVAPSSSVAPIVVPSTTSRRRALVLTGVGVLAGVVVTAVAAWAIAMMNQPTPRAARFAIVPPAAQPLQISGFVRDIAISSDGTQIVYSGGTVGQRQLMIRALDRLDAVPLLWIGGTLNAVSPFMSPDSRWIGFFESDEIKKVSITGGPAITVCKIRGNPRGASWGSDDTIVFATGGGRGLLSVPAGGGDPKTLTQPDGAKGEADHLFPIVLPGARAVLFTVAPTSQQQNADIAVLDLKTGERKTLVRGGSDAEYLSTGHLVYAAGGTLRAVGFDLSRLEVLGDPVPVLDQVMTVRAGAANFAVSRTGTLAYVPGGSSGGQGSSLVWVDRQGREEPINAPPRAYTFPRLSPDGTRVALDVRDQENDIWIWDLTRQTLTRLTLDPGNDRSPVWTPDSRRVIFSLVRGAVGVGSADLLWQFADGTGTVERLTTTSTFLFPNSIAPDGTRLVLREDRPKTGRDLSVLVMGSPPRTEVLIQTTFREENGEISPDGQWLAYQSNESGQDQIYVRPFPKIDAAKWPVSTTGGSRPLWARSGRELFYLDPSGRLTTVPVRTTPGFSAGAPAKVFETRYASPQSGRSYDVSPDGQRFLMIKDASTTPATSNATPDSIVVVLNWTEELRRLVPNR